VMIVLLGVKGVGKTTVGEQLSQTLKASFADTDRLMEKLIGKGALIITIYNPFAGLLYDLGRIPFEHYDYATYGVNSLNALHVNLLNLMPEKSKAIHYAHSEGGILYNRSFEKMSEGEQGKMQRHFYYEGIGPAERTPRDYGIHALNIYSDADWITGWFKGGSNDQYDVKWVRALSPAHERVMYFADHAFFAKTCQSIVKDSLNEFNQRVGFYVGNSR